MLRVLAAVPLLAAFACAADQLPAWAKEAASQTAPKYPTRVRAVELLHEEAVTVDPDGRRVMRERGVIRILQQNASLSAGRTYNTKSGRIRDFQAWTVTPGGVATQVPKNRILDVALSASQVYDELRGKVLEFAASPVGTVIAYEITEEEKTVFTQYALTMQDRTPRLVSRFSLTVPNGWEVRETLFNHPAVQASVSGPARVWELRDLPWREAEDYSPPLSSLSPYLAVSYFPPEGNPDGLRSLKDWTAVSAWLSDLMDPAATLTPRLRAKAAELTKDSTNTLDKIRAIARFAQQTNYVAVSLNLTRGGGYTPHRADDVLQRNYGDCKDKATLMRALLSAVGIESYVTAISADDPHLVRAEWASPMQFNHAILAIAVPSDVQLPTVAEMNGLGRLLMFDPTDPLTPVGDLPEEEQGSFALVVAGTRGGILRMPKLDAEGSRIESQVTGEVDTTGRITAKVTRRYHGQAGVGVRGTEVYGGSKELQARFARTYSRRIPGAAVAGVEIEHSVEDNITTAHVDLTAERFAQISAGTLFVMRPGLLTSGGEYFLDDDDRATPVLLSRDLRRDSIRLRIPTGFLPDEVPAPVKLEGRFGSFEANWTIAAGEIVMEETLRIHEIQVAAEEYAEVQEFFDRIAGSRGSPVVLVRR